MGKSEILVSISCITYNHAPYIRQCLDGFLMQKTDFAYEVLIHDDCSNDGTTEIIREYADKYPKVIKPMYEDENQYQKGKPAGSAVWNFPRAKGKYIAFCEGDDFWTDPQKLQKQIDFLESNPDYVLSCTDARIVRDSNVYERNFKNDQCFSSFPKYLLTHSNPIVTATACIRYSVYSDFIQELNTYPIKMKMHDLPLWIFASTKGKVGYLSDNTACYRVLATSASHYTDSSKTISFYSNALTIKTYLNERYSIGADVKKIISAYYKVIVVKMSQYSREDLLMVIREAIKKSPMSLIDIRVQYYILRRLIFNK